jgi:hypothetical protein
MGHLQIRQTIFPDLLRSISEPGSPPGAAAVKDLSGMAREVLDIGVHSWEWTDQLPV